MYERISASAGEVLGRRGDVLGDLGVGIKPYGYLLSWSEFEAGSIQQAFLPDGAKLGEPT